MILVMLKIYMSIGQFDQNVDILTNLD